MRKGPSKPFFRAHDRWWVFCTYRDGKRKQEKLYRGSLPHGEDTKPRAYELFAEWLLKEGEQKDTSGFRTISDLVKEFHRRYELQKDLSDDTRIYYHFFLDPFSEALGHLRPDRLTLDQVLGFLESRTGWKKCQKNFVIAVKRLFNWAMKEGFILKSPVRNLRRPPDNIRDVYLTREERALLYKHFEGDPFRDFLLAMDLTGCRPGEVSRVTVADVDLRLGCWVLPAHKTRKKTGKPRIVPMVPQLLEITLRLISEHPEGPLFISRVGKPWDRKSIEAKFRRARLKLAIPKDCCSYYYRAAVATDLLEAGVPLAQAAEILGNSPKVLDKFYSRLQHRQDHLREQLMKILPQPHDEDQ